LVGGDGKGRRNESRRRRGGGHVRRGFFTPRGTSYGILSEKLTRGKGEKDEVQGIWPPSRYS